VLHARTGLQHLLLSRDKKWKKGPVDPDELLQSVVPVRAQRCAQRRRPRAFRALLPFVRRAAAHRTPLLSATAAAPLAAATTPAVRRQQPRARRTRAPHRFFAPCQYSHSPTATPLPPCPQISSVRVVFIRHGESEWNDVFNKGLGPVRFSRPHAHAHTHENTHTR
jgi:hypothetical protein